MLSVRQRGGLKSPSPTSTFSMDEDVGAMGQWLDDLDFYKEPPMVELSLDEFGQYALARLKVRI